MLFYIFIKLILSENKKKDLQIKSDTGINIPQSDTGINKQSDTGINKRSDTAISIPLESLKTLLIKDDSEIDIEKSKFNYDRETGAYKLIFNIKKEGIEEKGTFIKISNYCGHFYKVFKWTLFFVLLIFAIALGFYVDNNSGWFGNLLMSPSSTRTFVVVCLFVLIYLMIWSCIFR